MAIVTIVIIVITVGLFIAAIFTKGLTHDIFLKSGGVINFHQNNTFVVQK